MSPGRRCNFWRGTCFGRNYNELTFKCIEMTMDSPVHMEIPIAFNFVFAYGNEVKVIGQRLDGENERGS